MRIWFWQTMLTPHIGALASALASDGHQITFVACEELSSDRSALGWTPAQIIKADVVIASTKDRIRSLANGAPHGSIHICQGLRSNGLIGLAQAQLKRGRYEQWAMMETIEKAGLPGILRRLVYAFLFYRWRSYLTGILAIGHSTPNWIKAAGFPATKIFPFAYFLKNPNHHKYPITLDIYRRETGRFRFIFVGQLIKRKRVMALLLALASLGRDDFELWVIGGGEIAIQLKGLADRELAEQVYWAGVQPMEKISSWIAVADCLVLPSSHDGWGAVISEAIMVGTPVICSQQCGAADVVRKSGYGATFDANNQAELTYVLSRQLDYGRFSEADRESLRGWAGRLGSRAGADYFIKILKYQTALVSERPMPPWEDRQI